MDINEITPCLSQCKRVVSPIQPRNKEQGDVWTWSSWLALRAPLKQPRSKSALNPRSNLSHGPHPQLFTSLKPLQALLGWCRLRYNWFNRERRKTRVDVAEQRKYAGSWPAWDHSSILCQVRQRRHQEMPLIISCLAWIFKFLPFTRCQYPRAMCCCYTWLLSFNRR
jgi:hypothetical protein